MDEEHGDLISSALQFDDITVESILTPRVDLTAINIDDDPDSILETIRNSNHSRNRQRGNRHNRNYRQQKELQISNQRLLLNSTVRNPRLYANNRIAAENDIHDRYGRAHSRC